MIRRAQGIRFGRLALMVNCLAVAALLPGKGRAEPDQALYGALSDCWNAVAGGGLNELSAYGMEFEETKVIREGVENHIYLGTMETGVGDIDIRASIRDGILFDCTMLTFPQRPDQRTVQYEDATETLDAWYGEALAREGFHDVFDTSRYHGLTWCGPEELAISANATGMDAPMPPEIVEKGATEPLTGDLRAVVFLTNSTNYEQCS